MCIRDRLGVFGFGLEKVVDVCNVADGANADWFGVSELGQGDGVGRAFTADHLSTVPAVVPAPEEVEGLQTAMAFLSVHIRHPAGRLSYWFSPGS